jgi:hypothetical protein
MKSLHLTLSDILVCERGAFLRDDVSLSILPLLIHVMQTFVSFHSIVMPDIFDARSCLPTHRLLVPFAELQTCRNDIGVWLGGLSAAAKHKHGNGSAETLWLINFRNKQPMISRSNLWDSDVSNNSFYIAYLQGRLIWRECSYYKPAARRENCRARD